VQAELTEGLDRHDPLQLDGLTQDHHDRKRSA
jgi:hypothetical protein